MHDLNNLAATNDADSQDGGIQRKSMARNGRLLVVVQAVAAAEQRIFKVVRHIRALV